MRSVCSYTTFFTDVASETSGNLRFLTFSFPFVQRACASSVSFLQFPYNTYFSIIFFVSRFVFLFLPPTLLSKYHLLKGPRVSIALQQIRLIQPSISRINCVRSTSNICLFRDEWEIFHGFSPSTLMTSENIYLYLPY